VVILVRWPWKADPDNELDAAKYIFKIVKNRNRPIVQYEVQARFNPARQTIDDGTPPASERHPEFDEFS
jgi:hypothetical protein